MFSLICVCINGWVNNREAGDLRRYRAHSDVTVKTYNQYRVCQWLHYASDIDLEWTVVLPVPRDKGEVISEVYVQVVHDKSIVSRNDKFVHIHFHVSLFIIDAQYHG